MPRWIDLSTHGVAIRLAGEGQAQCLVLEALNGHPVAEEHARKLGFAEQDSRWVRAGTRMQLSEIKAVYPKASVRDFASDEIRAAEPTNSVSAALPAPPAHALIPEIATPTQAGEEVTPAVLASSMSAHAFASAATFVKDNGRWLAAIAGQVVVNEEAAALEPRKRVVSDKVAEAYHAALVKERAMVTNDLSLPALCSHPKLAFPGSMSTGRSAAIRVMKLLDQLNIADEVMDPDGAWLRLSNPPYKDLVIERHTSGGEKYPQGLLLLTHYNRQDGESFIDAEMVFGIAKGRLWFKETASFNPFTGGESRFADRPFANTFSQNLIAQGFGKATVLRPRMEIDPFPERTVTFKAGLLSVELGSLPSPAGWHASWALQYGEGASVQIADAEQFRAGRPTEMAVDAYAEAGREIRRRVIDLQALGIARGVDLADVDSLIEQIDTYAAEAHAARERQRVECDLEPEQRGPGL